jgi:hypothetical protein
MNMRDQTDLTELIIELKKYGAGDPTKSDIERGEDTAEDHSNHNRSSPPSVIAFLFALHSGVIFSCRSNMFTKPLVFGGKGNEAVHSVNSFCKALLSYARAVLAFPEWADEVTEDASTLNEAFAGRSLGPSALCLQKRHAGPMFADSGASRWIATNDRRDAGLMRRVDGIVDETL